MLPFANKSCIWFFPSSRAHILLWSIWTFYLDIVRGRFRAVLHIRYSFCFRVDFSCDTCRSMLVCYHYIWRWSLPPLLSYGYTVMSNSQSSNNVTHQFFFFISQVCYYGVGNELLRPHSTGTSKMRSFESRAHRRAAAWAFRFNLLFCFIAYIFGICTDLRFLVDRKSVALPPVLQYNYRGQSWILLTEACPHLNVHSWNQIDSLETSCMNLTVRRELIKFLNNLNMHSWNQMDSLEVEVTFMDDIGDTVNYRILCEIMGLH